jgi:SAM-dependent methyltransferase
MREASNIYRLLGDEARLRLLRVLSRERLNVTELTGVLGLAQSGVSRHLRLLKEAGFVAEEREGGFTYHRLADNAKNGRDSLWEMLRAQFEGANDDPEVRADSARLQEVLRLRKESFRNHTADARDNRQLVPGRSWAAWSRALGLLLPPVRVADLGCGEGYLTIEVSRWARKVVAVDRSQTVLDRAQELGRRRKARNVTWKRGELEDLPLRSASVEIALLSQALHHASDPARAVTEAARVLVPGGRLLVLELRRHQEEWVRTKLGDRILGFSEGELEGYLKGCGLTAVRTVLGSSKAGDPFAVLIAVGHKPDGAAPVEERNR